MTRQEVAVYKIRNRGDVLPPGEMHAVRRTLTHGGLCILPSDTCYALAGYPLRRGVPELIDGILVRGQQEIPLSFASQTMVERYVDLGYQELRMLDAADRDAPLTIVAPVSQTLDPLVRDLLPKALNTSGTLGVRLPHSWVERQVSSELDGPITSAAIYYSDGVPVKTFDDAVAVVMAGIAALRIQVSVVGIEHPPITSQGVSSVVGFPLNEDRRRLLLVYREGAVSYKRLVSISGQISRRDIEDWT